MLPRRRCSRAHADCGLLTCGDNNERRLNLHGGVAQGVNDREHERRGNVSRPEVDDPDERRSGADGGTAEGYVVRDHHTTLTGRAFENVDVRSTNELFVPRGP